MSATDIRQALRSPSAHPRPGWVVDSDLAAAPETIASGRYAVVEHLIEALRGEREAPGGLHRAATDEIVQRIEGGDTDAWEPALRYAEALSRSPAMRLGGESPCASGLIRAVAGAAVEEAGATPCSPRQIIGDLWFRSGAALSPTAHSQIDQLVTDSAAYARASLRESIASGSYDRDSALESARGVLCGFAAGWMHSRLTQAPVMYGVWVRGKPKTKLPDVEWLDEALKAAAGSGTTVDATEAFRAHLSQLAR